MTSVMPADPPPTTTPKTTTDWNAVRAEFPALENWTYLNTATYGQVPKRGVQAIAAHFAHRDELACADFLDWYADADRYRADIARLINAAPEDIAFIPNAATALSLVAGGIDWKPGGNLVTLTDEFPNQLYLPALTERHGIEFRQAPYPQMLNAINERTQLVAISEVNYATGFRAPIAEVVEAAHRKGARVYIDGTQNAGALRIDVQQSKIDVLGVHGYKWMCSPTGIGFMYIAPEFRAKLPPSTVGWRSHHDWRNVDNLHHGSPVFTPSAQRYEGGGLQFGLLEAMVASARWMNEIGTDVIEQRVLGLAAAGRERLRELGAEFDDTSSQIIAAKFAGRDVSAIARELKSRRVVVAARHGYLRVSPHFYNNESDLERFVSELRSLL